MLLSNTRNTWILLYLFCDRDASMFQKGRKQKIYTFKGSGICEKEYLPSHYWN